MCRLVCPLLNNGLNYQPLCCALSTLWSMAQRGVAGLLPSWLGGAEGQAESPIAFVLVRDQDRLGLVHACCASERQQCAPRRQ